MRAVLLRARSELRARWRAWLSLTLILGVFGGLVIAIAAGARRTDSAYRRFLTSSKAYDVVVPRLPRGAGSNLSSESGITARVSLDRVEHLPQVADAVRFHIYGATGRDLEVNGSEDPRFN